MAWNGRDQRSIGLLFGRGNVEMEAQGEMAMRCSAGVMPIVLEVEQIQWRQQALATRGGQLPGDAIPCLAQVSSPKSS
ncbi:hypothetical protein RRF57_007866 [Xylaria bambusicola]|uniref:Uncharacterized protein n=1 Tax=Xylaria bambusicola TaxID=326684 RepID=A0AAN7Z7T6_9PEZI